MPNVTLVFADHEGLSPGYEVPSASFKGSASARFAAPEGYQQWILTGEVRAGSAIEWPIHHGDEVVYIDHGSVSVDGGTCRDGGAVIIERGAATRLEFLEDSSVVHFGQSDLNPPRKSPENGTPMVHVVDTPEHGQGNLDRFSDGMCPSCDLVLLKVGSDEPHAGGAHSHTADEIIYMLRGSLQVGRLRVETGMGIAVPAGRIYSIRSKEPWSFLNYRPEFSEHIMARKSQDHASSHSTQPA